MAAALVSLVLALPGRALGYSSWCNAYTCWSTLCADSPACTSIRSGSYCADWCSSFNCDQSVCSGCAVCATSSSTSSSSMLPNLVGPASTLNGILPSSSGKRKFVMGVDIDYPPYAYLVQPPYGSKEVIEEVAGVGPDMIKAMAAHCGFEVTVVQAHWSDCWGNNEIGQGLLKGWYDGCMTYTHAAGVRNRYLEFTDSWAIMNKPSGLITRLVDGVPHLKGTDTLAGKTIVDVTGWAPTSDTLYFVNNQCDGTKYDDSFTVVQGDTFDGSTPELTLNGGNPILGANDRALYAVLEGKADAMWIYADQAANYHCEPGATQPGWDCDLWSRFGTDFAYAQVGMFGWMNNGTTIAMSRKGSGIAELLDTCFADFQKTESFHAQCAKMHGDPPHDQLGTCVPNEYIKADPNYHAPTAASTPYMFPTSDMAAAGHSCSTGYCTCAE